ncbi:hypothetical protein BD779DRAFT_1567546 [Infundibulicybe gibba]|nr:hypothetical protein BD779DRAFT_1567546 [Infundibulicybe gibba]
MHKCSPSFASLVSGSHCDARNCVLVLSLSIGQGSQLELECIIAMLNGATLRMRQPCPPVSGPQPSRSQFNGRAAPGSSHNIPKLHGHKVSIRGSPTSSPPNHTTISRGPLHRTPHEP